MGGLKDWREVIHADLPERGEITKKTVETTQKMARAGYSTGSMRMDTGRIHITQDYEMRRRKVLNTPLP